MTTHQQNLPIYIHPFQCQFQFHHINPYYIFPSFPLNSFNRRLFVESPFPFCHLSTFFLLSFPSPKRRSSRCQRRTQLPATKVPVLEAKLRKGKDGHGSPVIGWGWMRRVWSSWCSFQEEGILMGRFAQFVSRSFRPVKCPNCCGHDISYIHHSVCVTLRFPLMWQEKSLCVPCVYRLVVGRSTFQAFTIELVAFVGAVPWACEEMPSATLIYQILEGGCGRSVKFFVI